MVSIMLGGGGGWSVKNINMEELEVRQQQKGRNLIDDKLEMALET